MNHDVKRWDLWWADVVYEDLPISERRPVLIHSREIAYIISFKITSHPPRLDYKGEYPIKLWKEAGLTTPSTIRCSKKLCLTDFDIDEKIGELHPVDIKEVRKILQEMYGSV